MEFKPITCRSWGVRSTPTAACSSYLSVSAHYRWLGGWLGCQMRRMLSVQFQPSFLFLSSLDSNRCTLILKTAKCCHLSHTYFFISYFSQGRGFFRGYYSTNWNSAKANHQVSFSPPAMWQRQQMSLGQPRRPPDRCPDEGVEPPWCCWPVAGQSSSGWRKTERLTKLSNSLTNMI